MIERLCFTIAFWLYGLSRLYICDGKVIVKASRAARVAERLGDSLYEYGIKRSRDNVN